MTNIKLTKAQFNLLKSLYEHYELDGHIKVYVITKWARKESMYALYKAGFITSTHIRQGKPTNMIITQTAIDFMKDYYERENAN